MPKIDRTHFPTFREIFDEFDDEDLIEFAQNNPKTLQKLCMFLSVDLQLEKENEEQNN